MYYEDDFHYSSASEWDNADAEELGRADADVAWVLTDRDVWHKNPYYVGEEVPHPEDDSAWRETLYAKEDDESEDDELDSHFYDPNISIDTMYHNATPYIDNDTIPF